MSLLTHPKYQSETLSTFKPELNGSIQMECGRLIHAAIISKSFRRMLLDNPVKSVETGYCGEKFYFTREEKARIKLIQAASLEEFASQLMVAVESDVVPNLVYAQ